MKFQQIILGWIRNYKSKTFSFSIPKKIIQYQSSGFTDNQVKCMAKTGC